MYDKVLMYIEESDTTYYEKDGDKPIPKDSVTLSNGYDITKDKEVQNISDNLKALFYTKKLSAVSVYIGIPQKEDYDMDDQPKIIGTIKFEISSSSKGELTSSAVIDEDSKEYKPIIMTAHKTIMDELADPFSALKSIMDDKMSKLFGESGRIEEITEAPETEKEKEKYIEKIKKDLDVADIHQQKDIKVNMADYVADNELKEELNEIVSFFNERDKYIKAGVDVPKGIMFKGPPGTGKTYAAQCICGSTDAIFVTTTASALQGMYIGSGAERVKKLFKAARQLAKLNENGVIVFIDEVDSISQSRSNNSSGHGEENRTLNQLLSELSGFNAKDNVMLIAATNYPESLDSAFTREGRISRHINIDTPDNNARKKLIKYYAKGKPFDASIKLSEVVTLTPGFTPAAIKEMLNEAAILSVRNKTGHVSMTEIDSAINKNITRSIKKHHKDLDYSVVATHEIGHVLAYYLYQNEIPIKVTCNSYGDALGFTQSSREHKVLETKKEIIDKVKTLLAGRAAEQVIHDNITTGASNDFKRAKSILKSYYEIYNFEKYDIEKLNQIVVDKIDEIYEEVVKDFKQEKYYNFLKYVSMELLKERVLRQADLSKVLKPLTTLKDYYKKEMD